VKAPVLHTWTQDLRHHLHVHALMACGALQFDAEGGAIWVGPKRSPNFLFPVHALSRVFRAKFLQALQEAIEAGALARDPASTELARRQRLQALRRHDWVVYAKTALAGPAAVLDYLARYTHRTAIGNERLAGIAADKVLLRVRADDAGASSPKWRMRLKPGGQDRAPGAGAQAAGDAASQPAGARGRAGLHAARGRYRRRVLPALQGRALARRAAGAGRSFGTRRHHPHCLPRAAVTRSGLCTSHTRLARARRPGPARAHHGPALQRGLVRHADAQPAIPRAPSQRPARHSKRRARNIVVAHAHR
jgi:hypothetical protein